MASTGQIKAGAVYVEVGARLKGLEKGLRAAEARVRAFGSSVSAIGQGVAGIGLAAAAPLGLAIKAFSGFDDAMAGIRASVNPTASELEAIDAAVMQVSKATGAGPAEVAASFNALLKAGVDVRTVLDGAGQAALQFARVAEMDAATAAEVLSDAMNVFGSDAVTTVDALSRAADASSISVADVAQSFAAVGTVAAQAGLDIHETANALAILGQNGVKGSDAGTSLKTALSRLTTGAESAGVVMKELGIRLRDSNGEMLPLRDIIGVLQAKLGGLNSEARDQALFKLFGSDAIRAGTILLKEGVTGFDAFAAQMNSSLSVAEKFDISMDTLSGRLQRAWAGVQRLGIAVGEALGARLEGGIGSVVKYLDLAADWAKSNAGLIQTIALVSAGVAGAGVALIALGAVVGSAATVFGVLAAGIGLVLSPLGAIVALAASAGAAWLAFSSTGQSALAGLQSAAMTAFGGIADALKAGDIGLAAEVLWLSLRVQFQKGVNWINAIWADWGTAFKVVVSDVQFAFANMAITVTKAMNRAIDLIIQDLRPFTDIFKALTGVNIPEMVATSREGLDAMRGELAQQKAAADEARFASAQASVAEGEAELARLQGELQAALDEARQKATQGGAAALATPEAAGGAGGAKGAAALVPEDIGEPMTPEGLGAALERSASRTDVVGGFNASAFRQLGIGDDVGERQLSESQEQTKLLRKIDDRARSGRLVFTS